MTSNDTVPPTRALVLGGGGAVGIGWQVGLLRTLRAADVQLMEADSVVATSAGAVVGALLAGGRDLTQALVSVRGLAQSMEPAALSRGNDLFLKTTSRPDPTVDPTRDLIRVGRAAQTADTIDEATYLELFNTFDTAWPDGFSCTAIDTESGELVIWGHDSGVPLRRAVAASCALPMLFPPVEVDGTRFMDGGLISHLNASATPPSDVALVISSHPLQDRGSAGGRPFTPSEIRANAELAQLRERSRVVALEFDDRAAGATPSTMMSPEVAIRALEVGDLQAKSANEAVRLAWNSSFES